MSMPFYVSPEQLMQDKAEYARKGISRGKSIVTLEFAGGILLIAENPSKSLQKIGEIYDRIAFAGVGKFSEFDQLRKIGVRYADTRGYAYSRDDVRGKALANAYSQVIGETFTREMKPLEVEIIVAEVGDPRFVGHEENSIYRVRFDGSISDEHGFCVIGGNAEPLEAQLQSSFQEDMDLAAVVRAGRDALGRAENGDPDLGAANLEVCLLEREHEGRKFRRLPQDEVAGLLA
ncbi:MAG: proteasome subunit alpha [Deltaproteobacteria bacterium]|nr:proteasome subunit alpha [Deltaproteobacteria bacterium]MBW2444323.1 proteasome subunit alpha [Deltaproteobacteria bacterium]